MNLQSRCQLNLVIPLSLEEQIIDILLDESPRLQGFLSQQLDSHGPHPIHDPLEQVRGRTAHIGMQILIDTEAVEPLLARIRADIANPDIRWWTTPVLASGELT